AVEHHQVEFAEAEAGVCRHRLQAGAQQVLARGPLDRVAALAGAAQPPPSGTTWPPLKVAQAGVRWTLPKPSMRRVPVAPRSSASAPVTSRSMNAVSSQASWPNANRRAAGPRAVGSTLATVDAIGSPATPLAVQRSVGKAMPSSTASSSGFPLANSCEVPIRGRVA